MSRKLHISIIFHTGINTSEVNSKGELVPNKKNYQLDQVQFIFQ